MNDTPAATSTSPARSAGSPADHPHLQMDLFRPPLQYPMHPYAEMLARTAERYPENEALIQQGCQPDVSRVERAGEHVCQRSARAGYRPGPEGMLVHDEPRRISHKLVRGGAYWSGYVTPMNPSYKEREVAYQLNDSEAVARDRAVRAAAAYPVSAG